MATRRTRTRTTPQRPARPRRPTAGLSNGASAAAPSPFPPIAEYAGRIILAEWLPEFN